MTEAHTPRSSSAAIVIATDDNYLSALPAFVGSLAYHNPGLDVPIICLVPDDIHDDALQTVSAVFHSVSWQVQIVPVTLPRDGLPTYRYVTPTGNFRLLIPDLLPELDRALYLDVDTLVLSDVTPMIDMELNDKAVGAVRDPINPCLGWPLALKGPPLPDEQARKPYCNAGVLLMDLQQWRCRRIGQAAMALIRDNDERLNLIDQDALNIVLSGDFLELPMEWNVYAYDGDAPVERNARILHFVGPLKPWMANYPSTANARLYSKYQRLIQVMTD